MGQSSISLLGCSFTQLAHVASLSRGIARACAVVHSTFALCQSETVSHKRFSPEECAVAVGIPSREMLPGYLLYDLESKKALHVVSIGVTDSLSVSQEPQGTVPEQEGNKDSRGQSSLKSRNYFEQKLFDFLASGLVGSECSHFSCSYYL